MCSDQPSQFCRIHAANRAQNRHYTHSWQTSQHIYRVLASNHPQILPHSSFLSSSNHFSHFMMIIFCLWISIHFLLSFLHKSWSLSRDANQTDLACPDRSTHPQSELFQSPPQSSWLVEFDEWGFPAASLMVEPLKVLHSISSDFDSAENFAANFRPNLQFLLFGAFP